MTDVPVQTFRSAIELFETQIRDEFGHGLVRDILEPMSAEYQSLSELSAQMQEEVFMIKAGIDNNRGLGA